MARDPTIAELQELVRLLKLCTFRPNAVSDHIEFKCYTLSRRDDLTRALDAIGVDRTAPT